ncbi:MAG: NAD(P)(+) transhydrogenase (Re/Si-specific) subunit beta [Gemmatimonadetes bacterium]|nr:NAD(P)(+) transhydrogenase (Re/Si-specific) subunit beta [Gemmatimonadota bacterium]
MTHAIAQVAYIVATALFIFALHWMNTPATARKGVYAGVAGMTIAVLVTWAQPAVVHHLWIVVAIVAGFAVGVPLANVPLTAVPQRTALSHAFGGLAAGLVGTAKYYLWFSEGPENLTAFRMVAIILEIILGFLTFTGSLMAAGKLQEIKWIPQRPVTYPFQNLSNLLLLLVAAGLGVALTLHPTAPWAPQLFPVIIVLALAFGVLLIIPIGGADMPTVIAILNAYAGLSAVAMGFVLDNKLLITAGALDGSSGLILAIIMCKAMNRSFTNVLFGAFGQVQAAKAIGEQKQYKAETAEGAAQVLEQASLVVIVPGYGMAVAQAQHKVRELYDQLKKRGITVKFAIHPVAGRMPGHMNVLLAEADIPYTDLVEMDEINGDMPQCDVCLVVGANDVVNPAARSDKASPIFGMPIIDADKARTIFAIKRSKNPGFAGIDNELYFADRTWMLFGDAKNVIGELVKQLAGESGMH